MIDRHPWKEIYPDGTVVEFNPFFQWRFGDGMAEINTRYFWGIGVYWKWTVGIWSRIKTRFIKVGPLTFYVHYGYTKPYNPQTGEVYVGSDE